MMIVVERGYPQGASQSRLLSSWKPLRGWRDESVSTDFHVLRRGFQSPAKSRCAATTDETAIHPPPSPIAPRKPIKLIAC
jgi:hypothetical protein